jgi:hypothetical protein
MFKTMMISAFTMIMAQSSFAITCPQQISVEASDFSSISSKSTSDIDKIFKLGDQQTEKPYIEKILKAANKLTSISEVLTLSKKFKDSSSCYYTSKAATLRIAPNGSEWEHKGYIATLKAARINYKSGGFGNPESHRGFAVDVVSQLNTFTPGKITQSKKSATLSFELGIQIPLGDYGTDGYTETATIGSAKSVVYQVVK